MSKLYQFIHGNKFSTEERFLTSFSVIPLFPAQFLQTVVNKRHRSSHGSLCSTKFSHISTVAYKLESQLKTD